MVDAGAIVLALVFITYMTVQVRTVHGAGCLLQRGNGPQEMAAHLRLSRCHQFSFALGQGQKRSVLLFMPCPALPCPAQTNKFVARVDASTLEAADYTVIVTRLPADTDAREVSMPACLLVLRGQHAP